MEEDLGRAVARGSTLREGAILRSIAALPPFWLREVLGEPEIHEFDLSCGLLYDYVLSLQISKHYPLLMQIVKQDQSLGCEELDNLKFDTDLFALELVQSNPFDRLHQEVHMLVTLEGRIKLWEITCNQVLLSPLLQMT